MFLTANLSLQFKVSLHKVLSATKITKCHKCDNSVMMRIQTSDSMFNWFMTGQSLLQSNILLCFSCHPIGRSCSQASSCAFPC